MSIPPSRFQFSLVLLCLALCCIIGTQAQLPAEFETQLQRAETAQEQRQPPIRGIQSSIVPQSPTAELVNGDGDISTIGRTWCVLCGYLAV